MDTTGQHLCETTKLLWRMYLLQSMRDPQRLISYFQDNAVVIGTGRHEFYQSADAFLSGLLADFDESSDMQFKVADEWYEALQIAEGAYVVYGGLHVCQDAPIGEILVDMDTRFSMVYARNPEGEWKVTHIHHSLPYIDQLADEYYPRSLSERASEAMEFADRMRRLASLDQMTGVLNHTAFFNEAQLALDESSGWWLFVMDIDGFKLINDERGHLAGDEVIIQLARTLIDHVGEEGLVGRVGGDEFAALVRLPSHSAAKALARGIELDFSEAVAHASHMTPGLSIGFTSPQGGTVQEAFAAADSEMYAVKNAKKAAQAEQ